MEKHFDKPSPSWLFSFLSVLLGVLNGFCFTPSHGILEFFCLSAFFYLVVKAKTRKELISLGFFFGLGWFGCSLSWIYTSVHDYGNQPVILSVFSVIVFAAFLSIFPLVACLTASYSKKYLGPGTFLILVFPSLWGLSEWFRSWIFTGFPWSATAYAHLDDPLAGYAPYLGACGINFLVALCCGLLVYLFLAFSEGKKISFFLGLLLLTSLFSAGIFLGQKSYSSDSGQMKFRLVQGGVSQDEKFAPMGTEKSYRRYIDLIYQAPFPKNTVIVLPETIFSLPVNEVSVPQLTDLIKITTVANDSLIFGGFIKNSRGNYENVAFLFESGRLLNTYTKHHLVPFGEFVPFGFRWFIDLLGIPMGDLQKGPSQPPPFKVNEHSVAVSLCYEDLFSEEILKWQSQEGVPELFINLSNLGWFGDSLALGQHLNISRMRAKEFSRPIVRATNTGATAYIDQKGKVIAELPYMRPGKLDVIVNLQKGRPTCFATYGNSLAIILMLLSLFLSLCLGCRKKTF